MRTTLKIAALILAATAMVPALAHALEYPGKMRLARDEYLTVQCIYYPGFTLAGVSEPLAVLVLAALLALTPDRAPEFWLIAGALAAAALTQLIYWTLTAPVNRIWLHGEKLSPGAGQFFGTRRQQPADQDWTVLRDRWERSHIGRAVTTVTAFVLLIVAVVS
jgi:hypothetical protein